MDTTNTPKHYLVLGITPLELAEKWIPKDSDPVYSALYADCLKYLGRHPYKGNPVGDLLKLKDCVERMIAKHEISQSKQSDCKCNEYCQNWT